MHVRFAIIAFLFSTASASAEPKPPPVIKGTFAFDVLHPKAKCRKVAGTLLRELERAFLCVGPDPSVGTASGKPLVARCVDRKPKKKAEWLLFASSADCAEERETQLANGG